MSEKPRIYPVVADVEAPQPTAPLMPQNSTRSEKGDPAAHPPQLTIPVSHSKPPKKKTNCCCRLICWTLSLLLFVIIAIAASAGILYLVFRPKLPKYSVDGLQITTFNIEPDSSLSAAFNINVTAENPNKRIGIYYEGGSYLSAWYQNTKLCEGAFPKFYQGHKNTTVINVAMTGQTDNGTELLTWLTTEQQDTGRVGMKLRALVPVRIKLGKLKLMKTKFKVRCNLIVDTLTGGGDIRIRSSNCKFRLKI